MIKKIIIYISITIGVAYLTQWFVLEGLRQNKKGIYDKYNTIFLKKNSYNTLMLGSSRMFMHLNNHQFDSLCGTHSYNLGLPGATARLAYIALKSYCLKSKAPKQIIYGFDYHISNLTTDTIYNFTTYIPFLNNPEFYRQLKLVDKRFIQFKYNPFYTLPYLGINTLSASLNGWFSRTGPYDNYFENGFFKNYAIDDINAIDAKNKKGIISVETEQYLDSIISFCSKNHIKLYFTISPAYKDVERDLKYHKIVIEKFKNLAENKQLKLFDYSRDTSITNHKSYFEDNYHLLFSGATIYTKKIATDFNNNRQ